MKQKDNKKLLEKGFPLTRSDFKRWGQLIDKREKKQQEQKENIQND